jgi:hypothetical protein
MFDEQGVSSTVRARALAWLLRWRFVVLIAWSVGWYFYRYATQPRGLTDWVWFEFGARTIVHLNSHYASGSLGLYAHHPVVQIGPPPILAVAAFQWLSPTTVLQMFGVLMAMAGVWCLSCAEALRTAIAGRATQPSQRGRWATLAAGLLVLPIWSWEVARIQHLDDVMAISFCLAAMAIISRRRAWWLAAILLGLGITSKPWALIMLPILLALPREDRPKAFLLALAALAAPWLPFVIGDHHTVSALADFKVYVDPRSPAHALGVPLGFPPNWLRPLQILGGLGLTAYLVRRGRWAALPMLVLGWRVLSDPQSWAYYGMGPLIAAALLDTVEANRLPGWTALAAVGEFGIRDLHQAWAGWAQIVWFVVVVGLVVRRTRIADGLAEAPGSPETSVPRVLADNMVANQN